MKRLRNGTFAIRLEPEERAVLAGLPAQIRELLDADADVLRRLFPPAYVDDPEREAEYRRYMRSDLENTHRAALAVVEATATAQALDEAELHAWVRAINQFRLVLGTTLDVSEDLDYTTVAPDDPRYPALSLYAWLSWLQDEAVDALAP